MITMDLHDIRFDNLWIYLLFFLFASTIPAPQVLGEPAVIVDPPRNVSARLTSSVTLTCGITGDVTQPSSFLEWKRYDDQSKQGTSIYKNPPGTIADVNKYSIDGTYNLVIHNVQYEDAGLYSCGTFDLNTPHQAYLVVMSEPSLRRPDTIKEGESLPLGCSSEFSINLKTASRGPWTPEIEMTLGDVTLTSENVELTNILRTEATVLQLNGSITAKAEHHGKNLSCVFHTESPAFALTSTTWLNVLFPVKIVSVQESSSYLVGEELLCTGDGNPAPDVYWMRGPGTGVTTPRPTTAPTTPAKPAPREGPPPRAGNDATLVVTEQMRKDDTWTCVVQQPGQFPTITTVKIKLRGGAISRATSHLISGRWVSMMIVMLTSVVRL